MPLQKKFPHQKGSSTPAMRRSFNPYSSAPPPPASLPDFTIQPSTIVSLSHEEAGAFIDSFLQTQDGKVLALHRLADYLLGRTQTFDDSDVKELEEVIEEERRRDEGVIRAQPEDAPMLEGEVDEMNTAIEANDAMPEIKTDKKRARKEERRLRKEKERKKRKHKDNQEIFDESQLKQPKTAKKDRNRKEGKP